MAQLPDARSHRKADHEILDLFLQRWSPRAMSGEKVPQKELMRLFEAARWAPSTYNEQEWRYLYAHRDSEHWQTFFDLLVEGNQAWCSSAGVLIVVLSHKTFERNGKPNPVHTFDSGLATENLFLQAATMELVAHGMAGFNQSKARQSLNIPDDYSVEAMIAIGKPGNPDDLPENYRDMDLNPTSRKPVEEFSREGKFSF